MRTLCVPLAVVLAFATCAVASPPGSPLDCSDWVFVEPGLSCTVAVPFPAPEPLSDVIRKGGQLEPTNSGALLFLRWVQTEPTFPHCGDNDPNRPWCDGRLELLRLENGVESIVAFVEDRAGGVPGKEDHIRPSLDCDWWSSYEVCARYQYRTTDNLTFDPMNGRLYVSLRSYCTKNNAYGCDQPDTYNGWWLAAFEGFATTFEVLQSYTPQPSALSFRTPYMPEGMQAADWFDTYYGTLATVGDWWQAQPMQCRYPPTPPIVGDYFEVPDTLPTPQPGHGYYYVTATTYLGERRYGRKRGSGQTTGRDPAVLPACE